MWRELRQARGLPGVHHLLASLAVPQQLLLSEAGRQVGESPKKIVKMSTVIDQQDETDVPTPSRSQVDIYFQNHIDTTGAEPLQEAAPSPEQIADTDEEPYEDFAVLTPLGRRMQQIMKLRIRIQLASTRDHCCPCLRWSWRLPIHRTVHLTSSATLPATRDRSPCQVVSPTLTKNPSSECTTMTFPTFVSHRGLMSQCTPGCSNLVAQ